MQLSWHRQVWVTPSPGSAETKGADLIGCDRSLTCNCSNHLTAPDRNPLFYTLIFLTPPVCLLVGAAASPGCERITSLPFCVDTYTQTSLVSVISWRRVQRRVPLSLYFSFSVHHLFQSSRQLCSFIFRWITATFSFVAKIIYSRSQSLHSTTVSSVCGSVLRFSAFTCSLGREQREKQWDREKENGKRAGEAGQQPIMLDGPKRGWADCHREKGDCLDI